MREAALGASHVQTADTMYNIALVCRHLENFEKSLTYFEKACTAFQEIYGDGHPEVTDAKVQIVRTEKLIERKRVK